MSASGSAQGQHLLPLGDACELNTAGLDSFGRFIHVEDQGQAEEDRERWVDQGDKLPDSIKIPSVKLIPIEKLKADGSNFEWWKYCVRQSLSIIQIQQVICAKLQRPNPRARNRYDWNKWSKFAAHWISAMLHDNTRFEIKCGLKAPEWAVYADDLVCDIDNWFKAKETSTKVAQEMRKWDNMQRGNFSSATKYLTASLRQLSILDTYGMRPHPFWILIKVMDNLEGELGKIEFIKERLSINDKSMRPQYMTWPIFYEFFNEIERAAQAHG
ncbi:hypothetical protein N7452_009545 [Penicillium brevicompactum]|uniref:Uncharacterized protein n=1 Tax=Penicillium brevicompactum TaxID=5074 RepID=A0A9W9Q926_PENBR|nr:hypothetical protein N7452_009545 [Penicillium brevicompactum]